MINSITEIKKGVNLKQYGALVKKERAGLEDLPIEFHDMGRR
jgi:hypothetical protein